MNQNIDNPQPAKMTHTHLENDPKLPRMTQNDLKSICLTVTLTSSPELPREPARKYGLDSRLS